MSITMPGCLPMKLCVYYVYCVGIMDVITTRELLSLGYAHNTHNFVFVAVCTAYNIMHDCMCNTLCTGMVVCVCVCVYLIHRNDRSKGATCKQFGNLWVLGCLVFLGVVFLALQGYYYRCS